MNVAVTFSDPSRAEYNESPLSPITQLNERRRRRAAPSGCVCGLRPGGRRTCSVTLALLQCRDSFTCVVTFIGAATTSCDFTVPAPYTWDSNTALRYGTVVFSLCSRTGFVETSILLRASSTVTQYKGFSQHT